MNTKPLLGFAALRLFGFWNGPQSLPKGGSDETDEYSKSSVQKIPRQTSESTLKSWSQDIKYLMIKKGLPGLTICVSKGGDIVWSKAFGYCDIENRVPCNPDAHMRIASISKALFSTTVVGPLIKDKKLSINSSIYDYLSEEEFPKLRYKGEEKDITFEQLLSHTSGIPHYNHQEVPRYLSVGSPGSKSIFQKDDQYNRVGFYQRKTFRNVIDALEPIRDSELSSSPGQFAYTTYGYTLLSAAVQKLIHFKSSQDQKPQIEDYWMKLLRKEWFMSDTFLDQDEPIIPNRSRYYTRMALNGELVNAPYTDSSVKWAGGGIISTSKDLVRFGNALIDCYNNKEGTPLDRSTLETLWKPRERNYALGWETETKYKTEAGLAVFHTGHASGASSILVVFPESRLVVAILTNLEGVDLRELAFSVALKLV